MTNILVDQLPEFVMIDERKFSVNTDFRACLKTIMAFEDNDLTIAEKQMVMLENTYFTKPNDVEQAFIKANWFLNGGEEMDDSPVSLQRLYSFSVDSQLIYSAFKQTHNIDLQNAELHWWKFLALFMDLGSDTAFCQLVGLRKRLADGSATKEERKLASDLGDKIVLPAIEKHSIEEQERFNKFMSLVSEGK